MAPCRSGSLKIEDDGCRCGDLQYWHCCPDGMDFCRCMIGGNHPGGTLICGETEPSP
jgi:hypothetical protein